MADVRLERLRDPVIVLGATSLIGRFLIPGMATAGIVVTAVSRAARVEEGEGPVRWIAVDLARPAAFPPAATVLSLSPIWLLPAILPALRTAGMDRLVAVSSTSIVTKQASRDPGERAVARRLAEAEAAVTDFCEAEGLAWTILRPTMIYAEGQDGNVSRLAGLIRRFGFLPLAGEGGGLRQPVHAEDLAWAVVAAAATQAAKGRIYDLPGGETLTYRVMAERIFEGLGRPPRIVTVPEGLWRLGLRLTSPVLPGVTTAMGDRMSEDLVFDPEPAARDFGWAPRSFRPVFGGA